MGTSGERVRANMSAFVSQPVHLIAKAPAKAPEKPRCSAFGKKLLGFAKKEKEKVRDSPSPSDMFATAPGASNLDKLPKDLRDKAHCRALLRKD